MALERLWIAVERYPFFISLLIRLALLVYGEWQDATMQVKFTDIDYFVFTDAARFVTESQSPYLRSTYRYTPLLSWLLIPNIHFAPIFGKLLFICCDLLAGLLLGKILEKRGLSPLSVSIYMTTWLFNPLVFTISTRGNAESILSLLVLATFYFLMEKRVILGSICFGMAVHFKIYPILYAFPLMFLLDCQGFKGEKGGKRNWMAEFLNGDRITFVLISAGTFFILGALMFSIYGIEFVEETFLYHLTRKDHRHNFSVYFYYIYLSFEQSASDILALLAFLPQFILQVLLGFYLYKDALFCAFAQTFAFVIFQKVCTSQYFIWFLCFLPAILPSTNIKLKWRGLIMILLWFLSQVLWLNFAYQLEFLGENSFLQIWFSGLIFFGCNCWILAQFILYHKFKPLFDKGKVTTF